MALSKMEMIAIHFLIGLTIAAIECGPTKEFAFQITFFFQGTEIVSILNLNTVLLMKEDTLVIRFSCVSISTYKKSVLPKWYLNCLQQ